MTTTIWHICDDEKFINSAIHQFEEVAPNQNKFYVLVYDENQNFKHVKEQPFVYRTNPSSYLEIINSIKKDDLVVFHSLSSNFFDFLFALPKKIKTVWLCFGFEVYNNQKYFQEDNLLAPITFSNYSEPKPKRKFKTKVKDFIKPFFRFFKPKIPLTSEERTKKAFTRIDYLGSSFEEEFNTVTRLIKKKKKFFEFWYYPIEQIVNIDLEINLAKKSILIGNSGFKTGNHLDVFDKIKNYNLKNYKIVIPLNYGKEDYILDISNEAQKQFEDNLQILDDFLPLDQYNKILMETGIAILFNKRQQAVGNTIALLWFGAKVFLSKNNPFYGFLKRKEVIVFSVEEDLNEKNCQEFLNLEQINHNRKIILTLLNERYLLDNLKQQLYKINE